MSFGERSKPLGRRKGLDHQAAAERYRARRVARARELLEAGVVVPPALAQVSKSRRERAEAEGGRPSPPLRRGRGFAAAEAQRAGVKAEGGCRILAAHELDFDAGTVPAQVLRVIDAWTGGWSAIDPMHLADRSLGGCDAVECTIAAARPFHEAYDLGEFDVLPYLRRAEEAHVASHLGIVRGLNRTTGKLWVPVDGSPAREDRLPLMTYDEQADAVLALGLIEAARVLSRVSWMPTEREAVVRS